MLIIIRIKQRSWGQHSRLLTWVWRHWTSWWHSLWRQLKLVLMVTMAGLTQPTLSPRLGSVLWAGSSSGWWRVRDQERMLWSTMFTPGTWTLTWPVTRDHWPLTGEQCVMISIMQGPFYRTQQLKGRWGRLDLLVIFFLNPCGFSISRWVFEIAGCCWGPSAESYRMVLGIMTMFQRSWILSLRCSSSSQHWDKRSLHLEWLQSHRLDQWTPP